MALDRVPAAARPAANSGARPQEQQTEEGVIRFIRDPDAAPEFAVKGMDGKTVSLAAGARKSRAAEFLGYVVRAVPHGSSGPGATAN